jgi:hypothetical protein
MRKVAAAIMVLALLVPGAAFAGSSTDAALGLGAFAVFNQIISGTGIFGGYRPAAQPVVVAAPVQERVIVREFYPVYVQPQPVYVPAPPPYDAPVYYAPAYAPARVIVVKERGWGHRKGQHGQYGYRGHDDRD